MMKKEMVTVKRRYLKPHTTIFNIAEECSILAASPNVRPGGDSGGSIEIVPLVPDVGSDDDVLEG
jgi:hypothetical protein